MKNKLDFNIFNKISKASLKSKYKDEQGNEYLSVSRIVDKYSNPFEEEAIAEKVAFKHNITKEEVLRDWDTKAKLSQLVGDNLHCYINTYLKYGRKYRPIYNIDKYLAQFHSFHSKFKERFEVLTTEQIVCDYDNHIMGIADVICYDTKDDSFFIPDWKSNNEIKKENKYNDNRMLGIFSQYPDANYYHYSLQINILTKICQKYFPEAKFKPGYIFHIQPNNVDVIMVEDMNFELYEIIQ